MVAVLKILSASALPVAIGALTLSSSSCSYSPFPTKLPISLRSASATRRLPFAALRMDSSATELKPSAVQVSLVSLRPWFSSIAHLCSCSIRFIVSDFSLLLQQDGILPELMVPKPLGDLGTLEALGTGEANFSGSKAMIRVADLIGRSIVVYETEDKSHPGITAAVIARSAGIGENYKKICTCDGVIIWESN
ncbi:hypothetical protein GW17_00013751 [Ensete ventricosum]|nr:hypothetical protein GW17_00013751 [Ensete ventricosum]